jgi:hypothetical protein
MKGMYRSRETSTLSAVWKTASHTAPEKCTNPRRARASAGELQTLTGSKRSRPISRHPKAALRPLYAPERTFQKTEYRPGETLQFDPCQPKGGTPVCYG